MPEKGNNRQWELPKRIILILLSGLIITGGSYLVYFYVKWRLLPLQQKLNVLCRCTADPDTYEVSWYYYLLTESIPLRVEWHVSKPFVFYTYISPDIFPDEWTKMGEPIDTKDNNWAHKDVYLSVKKVCVDILELGEVEQEEMRKKRSFDVMVKADTPGKLAKRRRVNVVIAPWSHDVVLSSSVVEIPKKPREGKKEGSVECELAIQNKGAPGYFVAIYEVYIMADKKKGKHKEGRLGVGENNENIIYVDRDRKVELKRQRFYFAKPGDYRIKTYVIKYEHYLMEDWKFWKRGKVVNITLDSILTECHERGVTLWHYSDEHRGSKVEVIEG